MKSGKAQIHNLPINDVTTLGAYAFELQQEAEARGEVLPPAVRLLIVIRQIDNTRQEM